MADFGQKTEQPTERRLKQARREGQFPASREFGAAVQFTAACAMAAWMAPWTLRGGRELMRDGLRAAFTAEPTDSGLVSLVLRLALPAMWRCLAAAGVLAAAVALAHLAVTRLGFSWKKLSPDFGRLNPAKRLKGLASQNASAFFQAVLMLPLFAWAVWAIVESNLALYVRLPLAGVESGVAAVASSIEDLLWKAAALLLAFGAVDLYRQKRRHARGLRMSKQEIREELKEVEGNPQIKMRIRRLQRDLLRRQMMREVPKATAVIVNPTHYAVAIRYRMETMAAPMVVAKGRNYLARRIREIAQEHEIPIIENAPLAQALYKAVDVGQEIPAHLYRAVAEVLAYIYRIMGGRLRT